MKKGRTTERKEQNRKEPPKKGGFELPCMLLRFKRKEEKRRRIYLNQTNIRTESGEKEEKEEKEKNHRQIRGQKDRGAKFTVVLFLVIKIKSKHTRLKRTLFNQD